MRKIRIIAGSNVEMIMFNAMKHSLSPKFQTAALVTVVLHFFAISFLPASAQEVNSGRAAVWQRDTIAEGLIYHSYQGIEPITGTYQLVNVLEVDMKNPRYRLKFTMEEKFQTTAEAASRNNALAAINATYEKESVFIRVDGHTFYDIPNPWVMSTPVRQWRNDGGLYLDKSGRKIRIASDGVGKSYDQTRRIYSRKAKCYPNIFTSAPVLIDNWQPVGKTFAEHGFDEKQIQRIHYEDPQRHQHVRHPRTAIALTDDNRVLLVTVDGRWPGFAEGMSACELTTFLEKHFAPRYALNLDGGGSTTMVVKGKGDPQTGVVNYPTNNRKLDHDGLRATPTHILVVEN